MPSNAKTRRLQMPVVGVRVTYELLDRIDAVAESEHLNRSQTLRFLIDRALRQRGEERQQQIA